MKSFEYHTFSELSEKMYGKPLPEPVLNYK